jgi:segregation and condensation protein B
MAPPLLCKRNISKPSAMEPIEVKPPEDATSEQEEAAVQEWEDEGGAPAPDSAPSGSAPSSGSTMEEVTLESLAIEPDAAQETPPAVTEETDLRAVIEAIIYITEEPLTVAQIATGLNQPEERIRAVLAKLADDYSQPERGIIIREVAGGYKMATKPEHHEAVRTFVKSLKPPLKLSLAALETLAVIAYKQPITAPEIMEIRGVQGAGVLKTLIDRKLIATAGRKQVVGKPILYKTTRDFLLQFGLKDLTELPTLKEFEELRRLAWADTEVPAAPAEADTEKKGPGASTEEPPAQNAASD